MAGDDERRLLVVHATQLEDGRVLSVSRSTAHPKYPPTGDNGCVRSHIHLMGEVYTPQVYTSRGV